MSKRKFNNVRGHQSYEAAGYPEYLDDTGMGNIDEGSSFSRAEELQKAEARRWKKAQGKKNKDRNKFAHEMAMYGEYDY